MDYPNVTVPQCQAHRYFRLLRVASQDCLLPSDYWSPHHTEADKPQSAPVTAREGTTLAPCFAATSIVHCQGKGLAAPDHSCPVVSRLSAASAHSVMAISPLSKP